MPAELVIVIVSYNARAHLEGCLQSLHAAPPAVSHDIVVVDNASADGSAEAARRWPRVRVIEHQRNLGFAAANNSAIRATASELILLLNSDTIVPAGAIDLMVARLNASENVAVVGPRIVDGEGRAEISYGPMIGPFNELSQKLRVWAHRAGPPPIARIVDRSTRREHHPDWVSGACLLVRREAAEAVGLLDERFFMYGEDVDFCAAVRRHGRQILFTPDAEVVHLGGQSGRSAPAATREAYRRSQIAFYRKHHPRWVAALQLYLALKGQLPADLPPG